MCGVWHICVQVCSGEKKKKKKKKKKKGGWNAYWKSK